MFFHSTIKHIPEDFNYKRGKAIPGKAQTAPEGTRRLRLQFSRWHMKVVRMSALCIGHIYPQEDIPCANFHLRLSRPHDRSVARKIC